MPLQNGSDAIMLENEALSVVVQPSAGGNISALVDRRTGRNWLWSNAHIPLSDDRSAESYVTHLDSGGWDEILLSVTPELLELPGGIRRRIPDHGDLLRQRWSRIDERSPVPVCSLAAAGEILDYDFRRRITLLDDRPQMHLRYSLTNNEDFAWPWYWCAHALIAAQPGMRIELPATQTFRLEGPDPELGPDERVRRWPHLDLAGNSAIDLSDCFARNEPSRDFFGKFFVKTPDDGSVAVSAPGGGEKLTMRFDRGQLPWLGLWINNRGWSGCGSEPYLNLGLEPATAPFDSVTEAIRNNSIDWLQPGETREWSLEVELAC